MVLTAPTHGGMARLSWRERKAVKYVMFPGAMLEATESYVVPFVVSGTLIALGGIVCLPARRVARWETDATRHCRQQQQQQAATTTEPGAGATDWRPNSTTTTICGTRRTTAICFKQSAVYYASLTRGIQTRDAISRHAWVEWDYGHLFITLQILYWKIGGLCKSWN